MADDSSRHRLQAVILAMLMVMSVFAFTITLTGAAAAQTGNNTIVVDDDGGEDHTTIQDAIDAASPGDTIEVKPGTYQESGNFPSNPGLLIETNNVSIVGVDSNGDPITDRANTMADVKAQSDTNFGTSGVVVKADNVTISGLDIHPYPQASAPNKNLEVYDDHFTLRHSIIRADQNTQGGIWFNGEAIQTFTIEGNLIEGSIGVADGAGNQKPDSARLIQNNRIVGGVGSYGSSSDVGWLSHESGFVSLSQNNISDGVFVTEEVPSPDWKSIIDSNTFTPGVVTENRGESLALQGGDESDTP